MKQAEKHADYPLIDVGVDAGFGRAGARAHRPLRTVPAAGRRRARQNGVAAAEARAGRSRRSRKRWRSIRAKAEGPRVLGVDPKTGMNVYAIHGRFGAYVQLGETPEKGSKEKPKRSSLTGGLTESTVTLERSAEAARAAARARARTRNRASRSSPASAASVRT